ncbi:hypothetical protein RX327_32695 [Bradyrhizobium sp. BEA-2-5]|uniref:hypothetical protein n=1 Tax=Bradyrhizobium sp. BEA-2-5 TaxID=3080015 RepID=UPI00293E8529|nr:hypothetical protein [Bradyrhizobium sp. BEA-2-5]WOH80489.1 hypothetical protein RX327_32695 [Bradyrhizobium sp. BEA-2-5]
MDWIIRASPRGEREAVDLPATTARERAGWSIVAANEQFHRELCIVKSVGE